ncbi:MAG: DNA cytosine methyltransferase [Devosia sp.]
MTAYYNENDPYAAQWLRNLIAAGHIAPGGVDERSIVDVRASDLKPYTQCHFFAGIGGWSLALRLAGWPDDRPVWTGSCPCQPFSAAGKQRGFDDERHLWPAWFDLIRQCAPVTVFGEQVESAVRHGWLDGVCADLEREDYTVGACVLGAHSVGAPHIRQRLWWVADSSSARLEKRERDGGIQSGARCTPEGQAVELCSDGVQHPTRDGWRQRRAESSQWGAEFRCGADGKQRRIEPSIQPLAHGIPNRVGRLRAYGNAIVPQVAAKFIIAFNEVRQ